VDQTPPRVVSITPDSGAVNSRVKEVVVRFDEVVSETPRTGQDLRSAVMISPRDGEPNVSWHHNSISIRPRRGWRDSTTYVITLLPGITDLDGNARDSATVMVFSTGPSIPATRISGVTFDWVRNVPAQRAYIEAYPVADTLVRYTTEADSSGRFILPFIRPGAYVVRALIDSDRNKAIDARESWDSVRVELRDSVAVEMYLFPHDTGSGPRITSATVLDSVTIRVALDKPVTTRANYVPGLRLQDRDSVVVPIRRFVPWPIVAAERERRTIFERDSAANADTSSARRAARVQARTDSINRAAILADSLARMPARLEPPKPSRPPLVTEYAVELQAPLVPGTTYRLIMTVMGISGLEQTSSRDVRRERPAAADSAGGRGRGSSRQ
jgi:hypothetical protein